MNKRVIGNPTITPMAVPDWKQTDPTKADYIKNKPDLNKKADKTIFLSKTTKIDNGATVTDTIPVGSEIILKVTGLPKLQEEDDAYYVEYGFREDRNDPFLAVDLTPDDKGNATISLPVTSDLVPDADVADVFWIAVCTEFGGIAELTEPLTVEYTCLENISTSVARHETLINDMSDGLVKGFGIPFDVSGAGFVNINNVHPKEHDVEVLTDAESVTVCGKNILDIVNGGENDNVVVSDNVKITKTDNTYIIQNFYRGHLDVYFPILNAGKTYTFYCEFEAPMPPRIMKSNKTTMYTMTSGKAQSFSTTEELFYIRFSLSANETITVTKPQLEFGSVATKWEEFKSETYLVTDGKVIVPSVSPTMNITASANINAKGYQDGLAIIDELKQAIISLGGNI